MATLATLCLGWPLRNLVRAESSAPLYLALIKYLPSLPADTVTHRPFRTLGIHQRPPLPTGSP